MRSIPCRPIVLVCWLLLLSAPAAAADDPAPAGDGAATDPRLERIEDHLRAVEEELKQLQDSKTASDARVGEVEDQVAGLQSLAERVRLGGYGSLRWDQSSLADAPNTFTFRRLVLTTEAQLAERLRFYSELEYERFRKLELERSVSRQDGGLSLSQAVGGTSDSEISLEQAWLEWEFDPRLRLRAGGVLVPLGRFNRNHDDNQWDLPRRTLVDRGVPVLPVAAAWDELGIGLNGTFQVGEGDLAYELYVVNGAALDGELEQVAATRSPDTNKLAFEAEFGPQTGTFSSDTKEGKAVAGRLAWSPAPGHEIAASFYTGRYTPGYLEGHDVLSLALDGITHFGGFELEGELVTTEWGGLTSVAKSFAAQAVSREAAIENSELEAEVEFELTNLAKRKTGYWLELRYPFWPAFLPSAGFSNPQLVPVVRFEQVWFEDRLVALDFTGGDVTGMQLENRLLQRGTIGLAYRPTPLIVFSAAYEYTWTDRGGLAGLTNFLSARADERAAQTVSMGVAFGF